MDLNQAAGQSTNPPLPRSMRRKKKYNSQLEDQDLSIDKNSHLHSTFVRWEKTLGKIPHRGNYASNDHRKRLAGGADKDVGGASKITTTTVIDKNPARDMRENSEMINSLQEIPPTFRRSARSIR